MKLSYHAVLAEGTRKLEAAGVPDAAADAWYLMEECCRMNRASFLIYREEEMPKSCQKQFSELLEKRCRRIPLQHLTGVQEFMGLPFQVNEHVLIPRQDTEILVEEVLKQAAPGMRILDMCTGSGCILISLLKLGRALTGVGCDISADALAVAERNADALLDKGKAGWLLSDMFARVDGLFDVIVSNPPYIPAGEIPALMPEVRLHEPVTALDGGADGLAFYRVLAEKSREYLTPGGLLAVEIGWDQREAVSALFLDAGFSDVRAVRDLAGLDRVVMGRLSPSGREQNECNGGR